MPERVATSRKIAANNWRAAFMRPGTDLAALANYLDIVGGPAGAWVEWELESLVVRLSRQVPLGFNRAIR